MRREFDTKTTNTLPFPKRYCKGDPRDGFPAEASEVYGAILRLNGHHVRQGLLQAIAREVEWQFPGGLSSLSRLSRTRMPNIYSWLHDRVHLLTEDVLADVIETVKGANPQLV
jgi:hypothetical protein